MKIEKDVKRTLAFDPDRCNDLYTELVEIFQKHKPTVGEIIIAMGNLLYSLGASIEKYGEKGPSFEELKKLYYMNPGKVGLAMMMQGLTMTTWYEDWERIQLGNTQDTKEESE